MNKTEFDEHKYNYLSVGGSLHFHWTRLNEMSLSSSTVEEEVHRHGNSCSIQIKLAFKRMGSSMSACSLKSFSLIDSPRPYKKVP